MHTQPHLQTKALTMLSSASQLSLLFTIIFLNYLQNHHLPSHPHLPIRPTYLYRNSIKQATREAQVAIPVSLKEYLNHHEFMV